MKPWLQRTAATLVLCSLPLILTACGTPHLSPDDLPVLMSDELRFLPAGTILQLPATTNAPAALVTNATPGVYYSARAHALILHRRIDGYQHSP